MLPQTKLLTITIIGLAGIVFGLALRTPQGAVIVAVILVMTWLFQ